MYFGKFYPLELLTNKRFSGRTIRFWHMVSIWNITRKKLSFYRAIIHHHLMIWNFWPMTYQDITWLQSKWHHLPFKNFGTPFEFHLYGVEKTCANFDALVAIWTIIDLNSPNIKIARENGRGNDFMFILTTNRHISKSKTRIQAYWICQNLKTMNEKWCSLMLMRRVYCQFWTHGTH